LRKVKDPFRAALAARRLPVSSRIRILQAGTAMEPALARRARAVAHGNPRYRWLGGLPRARARRRLAGSRLLVLSSRMEGGANVISEAVVDAVPVLASRIPGSVGLLGTDYPGYFPVGDTAALGRLLRRAERDPRFYRRLKTWCARLAPRFRPARERAAWRKLLGELARQKT
jgi:glycosyltransferase involved in cell wall biosynthesis